MLKVVTAREMQLIDRTTIERYGVDGKILMEKAGLAVIARINNIFPDKNIVVLCGGGNNGGDGFVVARILHNQGRDVKVFLTASPQELKGDAKINYLAAKKFSVQIHPIKKFLTHYSSRITHHDIIVDALLGTGLKKEVKAPLVKVIKKINGLKCAVVSIDIPSGISSDNGQIMGSAVKAQHTVTFGLPKRGHLLYPGAEYAGELFIEDIGFPSKLLESENIKVNLLRKEDILSFLPERPKYSHKGTYGHVLLIAGSKGKTGAAFMSAKACLRSGAGLVTIGVPETLVNIFQSRVTEEMILPLHDKGNGTLSYRAVDSMLSFINTKATVLAIGPGISTDNEISRLVRTLIAQSKAPVVIDADAINAIAGRTRVIKKRRAPIVLTPHPGEMARLLGGQRTTVNSHLVEKDRINSAISFAKKTKSYLVLKGVPTIIASPSGEAFINSSGNPGMATAGTGDVLTGMIAAFIAQKLSPQNAAILGVYMHGMIGDIVAEKKGERSLIASDIINAIPAVFKTIIKLK